MLVTDPEAADRVRLMFEMYADPDTSFGDIARYFAEQGIDFNGKELQRATLSYLFENRRLVVDGLISRIEATSESVQVEWRI